MAYRPINAFNVPLVLLTPVWSTVNGVRVKTYPAIADGVQFFGSFKTYGGTETTSNGILSIEDTADVEAWFMPNIVSGCRIAIAGTTKVYDIIGEPENIEMRNQFIKFKVRRVKGGA